MKRIIILMFSLSFISCSDRTIIEFEATTLQGREVKIRDMYNNKVYYESEYNVGDTVCFDACKGFILDNQLKRYCDIKQIAVIKKVNSITLWKQK